MDEDKENVLPELPAVVQTALQTVDEPELENYYEDSNRRFSLINEKRPASEPPKIFPVIAQEPQRVFEPPKALESKIEQQILLAEPSISVLSDFGNSQAEVQEEYQKVSVKDLVSTFESFQQREKVHVNKERFIKELSTESEVSEGKQSGVVFPLLLKSLGQLSLLKCQKKYICSTCMLVTVI